ncbi:polyprenyl synthetase family protein [Kitasatospora sp. NPDC093679]|uniref:polyprenyl synthetase family protein n=1 Tax=Kitasatospora sp. NPDC093679 TaxID=3154983 RepID=UPI003440319E
MRAAGLRRALRAAPSSRPSTALPDDAAFCREVTDAMTDSLRPERHGEDGATAVQPFTDSLVTGGKRMRARLLRHAWLACRRRGRSADTHPRVVELAAALELIQACAVVHDDVMDASALRRGGPALHVSASAQHRAGGWSGSSDRYGVSMAILAGDLALARADDLAAAVAREIGGRGGAVLETWRRMRADMVAGQALELRLQAEQGGSSELALTVASLKSGGYSVQRPLELGADLAGATRGRKAALSGFGQRVGLAFQLADDLRDLFGDAAELGKDPGGDIAEGKRTYLVLRALETAAARGMRHEEELIRSALASGRADGAVVERVRAAVSETGADHEVCALVARLRDEACAFLSAERFDDCARGRLLAVARRLTAVPQALGPRPAYAAAAPPL